MNPDVIRRRDTKTVSSGRLEDALTSIGNTTDPITIPIATTVSDAPVKVEVGGNVEENKITTDVDGKTEENTVDDELVEEAVCEAFETHVFTTGITEGAPVVGDDDDEEEEIDEYLDDEDEPDDSMGDENVMLRKAHESAQQALCREKAVTPSAVAPISEIIVPLASPLPVASECNGASGQQEPSAVPVESLEGCDSPPPILTQVIFFLIIYSIYILKKKASIYTKPNKSTKL